MFVVSCQIPKLSFKSDIVIFLQNYVVPLPGVSVLQPDFVLLYGTELPALPHAGFQLQVRVWCHY